MNLSNYGYDWSFDPVNTNTLNPDLTNFYWILPESPMDLRNDLMIRGRLTHKIVDKYS